MSLPAAERGGVRMPIPQALRGKLAAPVSAAPMQAAAADDDTVDFYFDFASPYAYFAHGALSALTQHHGLRLRHRPILLWAVLKELGLPTPMEQAPKRRYLEHDMVRSAAYLGLPFRLPPGFPVSGLAAARAFHTLEAQSPPQWPQQAGAFVEAVFKAYFVDGRDIAAATILGEVAASVGLAPQQAHQATEADEGKTGLRQAIAEAAQRGVWGSPFWFCNGEGYFGADRLGHFERCLQLARPA